MSKLTVVPAVLKGYKIKLVKINEEYKKK